MCARMAFLTDEFVTERPGGLATYLHRITVSLREMGHEPEVFVVRRDNPVHEVLDFHGVRVERVPLARSLPLRVLHLADRVLGSPWGGPSRYLRGALALARALEARHAERPFDFVQSTNCGASGLFVRRVPGRPHLVRLSSHRGKYWEVDGLGGPVIRAMIALERYCVRRADIAYAPSAYLARLCSETGWRSDVQVVRPPAVLEAKPAPALLPRLPERYLLHFGQIGRRKGSEVLARALPIAWRQEPGLHMIWAGREILDGDFAACRAHWGAQAENVTWLGQLDKPVLYAVLARAECAVLPSLTDNLPNTVIESLLSGIPVIGSAGASIDELVEPGASGELVPVDDAGALAAALVRAWRQEAAWMKNGFRPPAVLGELEPRRAAHALLALAGQKVS